MRSKRTSSSSAAICASAVRVPVPRSTLPQNTVTRLSGPIVSQESVASFATDFGARSALAAAGPVAPNIEKPTARTPVAFRKCRRSNEGFALGVVMAAPSSRPRRALDGGADASMGPAAAEIAGERLADLRLARVLVRREQRGRAHDHAVHAVAALG